MRNERAQGVTLLELVICVVVVAMLAALAVPAYRGYVLRAQRTDAHAALLRIHAEQERHFLQHHRYASHLGATLHEGLAAAATSEHGYYALQLQVRRDGMGFIATATPTAVGGQRDDGRCSSLSIDEAGRRGASGSPDAALSCWR